MGISMINEKRWIKVRSQKNCYLGAVLLMCACLTLKLTAQVSVYAAGAASDLKGGPGGDYLYGGTVGVLLEGVTIRNRLVLSADVQTRYVQANGKRLVGVGIGPRIASPIQRLKLSPYAEFLVGFARYRASTNAGSQNTTDNEWQCNIGLSRQLSSRMDASVEYSYSQFGANNGEFNPKTYAAGVIFHLFKR